MSNSYFKFKQFTIEQEGCAMKVGTDGCLLGAWFNTENSKRILDIGTGTGLVAIMAAQRSNAHIVGIEIDSAAACKATENAKNSPWKERIEITNMDLQDYKPGILFDTIVSNPPYFTNSLKCDNEKRTLARHNDTLSPALFFSKAKDLLTPSGTVSLIIPTASLNEWVDNAIFCGFVTKRITHIQTTPRKVPKRSLIEFCRRVEGSAIIKNLILESSPGVYSEDACSLLREFYLKIK